MADITAVAFTDQAPFAGDAWGSVFVIEGRPDPARVSGDWPWTDVRAVVSDGYFRTMRIPVTGGRAFDAGDQETSQAAAIVNDALARQYWPGESAVGRRIRFPGMAAGQWLTIVGTVETTKWQSLSETPLGALYLPIAQASPGTVTVLARASEGLGPDVLGPRLRAAVAGLDRDMPVDRIGSVDALVGASAGASRFLAVLFSGFAGVGALLGAIGIYGVTADAVARRRHEIAVRLAMGAGDAGVVGLLVRQSAGVAAAGVLAGVAGALAGGRFVAGLLHGVSPADPITFTIVPAVLLLVVVAASYLPARRATRVRPLDVLRGG
jgi:putative ABC transport system permease protein